MKIPFVAAHEHLGHVPQETAAAAIEQAIRENAEPEKASLLLSVFRQLNEYLLGIDPLSDRHQLFFGKEAITKHGYRWMELVLAGTLPPTVKIGEFIERKCFEEMNKELDDD